MAAALWFRGWAATDIEVRETAVFYNIAQYEPGQFYLRELPCLLGVLARGPKPEVVVVDGYVWLEGSLPGLGARLHQALGGTPVVGVAKTRYAGAAGVIPVHRGRSRSPLFVSAVGLTIQDAAAAIGCMSGLYRIPSLLGEVDRLARTASPIVLKG